MVEELIYGYRGKVVELTLIFKEVNIFQTASLENREAVYLIYDKDDNLKYVGETSTLKTRIGSNLCKSTIPKGIHRGNVGRIMYCHVNMDKYERHVVEGLLVDMLRPAINSLDKFTEEKKVGNGKLVTKEIFMAVMDLKEAGHLHREIAEKVHIAYPTVAKITNLDYKKYQIWNQERLAK